MRGFAFRRRRKFADARRAHLLKLLVFQESRVVERIEKMFLDLPHLDLACDANQRFAEIERGLLTVKASQARHQLRRDQQHRIRKSERIADQQPRVFRIGGGNKVKAQS